MHYYPTFILIRFFCGYPKVNEKRLKGLTSLTDIFFGETSLWQIQFESIKPKASNI